MRKWIWASTLLTVAVACGFYGVASWANQHPLSVLNFGARLASVVGLGHTHVVRPCPAPACVPNQDEEGPCAVVQEMPDASPTREVSEPIVVEHVEPLPPESSEPPAGEPPALPPLVEESEPPVLEMPPCPEDIIETICPTAQTKVNGFRVEQIPGSQMNRYAITWQQPVEQTSLPQALNQTSAPGIGPISDCVIDPNYHHQYPGCPWMGGCNNIPAYVPILPAERTRTRPAKIKWLAVQALMERLGLSGLEPCDEPAPADDDGDPVNLTDIIF